MFVRWIVALQHRSRGVIMSVDPCHTCVWQVQLFAARIVPVDLIIANAG